MNLPPIWPIANLVIFDCDSTLSTIEGIDELARMTGHEYDVAMLTKRAMEGDIPLEAVYGHRLVTANPNQEQVRAIASLYRETVVPDAPAVIEAVNCFVWPGANTAVPGCMPNSVICAATSGVITATS